MSESISVLETSNLIINHSKIWHPNLDSQDQKTNAKTHNVRNLRISGMIFPH